MSLVRKAIIPAAGFGTRFLPFTKAVPKELLPLVDKPVIQYVVEEAAAAGIEEVLIVLSPEKNALLRHFSPDAALQNKLHEQHQTALLAELQQLESLVHLHYVVQPELNGLGGALLCGRAFAGNDPVAVLLGDTVTTSPTPTPVIGQLLEVYERYHASVIALERVPQDKVQRYGIVAGHQVSPRVLALDALVEKPTPQEAPSNLAVASRYVFTPELFPALEQTLPGKKGEIQLPDANNRMLHSGAKIYGVEIAGQRHDLGDKLSFLENTVTFGLKRPEFRAKFAEFILQTAENLKKEQE